MRNITKIHRAQAGVSGGGGLPAGAIPCESVFTNGYGVKNFIDTGILPRKEMSFEADITWVSPSNANSTLMGHYINNARYTPFRIYHSSYEAGFHHEVCFNNFYSGTNKYPIQTRYKYRLSITNSGATLEVFDKLGVPLNTEIYTYNQPSYNPSVTTMGIFGRKKSSTEIEEGSFRGMLHALKIYGDKNFSELLADYLPCFYNGVFGVWDTRTKVFKTVQNPSYFIGGFGEYWNTQGFVANTRNWVLNDRSNYLLDYRAACTSRLFEVPEGCSRIRFDTGAVSSGTLYNVMYFSSSLGYLSYNDQTERHRVVTIPANAKYIRLTIASMGPTTLNQCYVYDMDNEQYIWKGIEV